MSKDPRSLVLRTQYLDRRRSLEKDAYHHIKEVPYLLRSDRGEEMAGKVPDT
jgi:hypothetical protein